jgi:hypothetical protein
MLSGASLMTPEGGLSLSPPTLGSPVMVSCLQYLSPFSPQSILLLAAAGLVRDGHFDQSRSQCRREIQKVKVFPCFQSQFSLQSIPIFRILHHREQLPYLGCHRGCDLGLNMGCDLGCHMVLLGGRWHGREKSAPFSLYRFIKYETICVEARAECAEILLKMRDLGLRF